MSQLHHAPDPDHLMEYYVPNQHFVIIEPSALIWVLVFSPTGLPVMVLASITQPAVASDQPIAAIL